MTDAPTLDPDWILEVRQWLQDRGNTHAAAVTAAKDARIKVLEDALRMALAELDELPVWSNTGHVCNIARAALGDKICSG